MKIAEVWAALEEVKDPEIPVVSVVEMGIIHDVQVEDERVTIDMTPTFVGCPALDLMRETMRQRIAALGAQEVTVRVTFDPPWNSNRITPAGRRKLKEFGLAPPPRHNGSFDLIQIVSLACPHCGSSDTTLESPFGPTLCRAIHYCNNCQQSFEQFKPL
ncbi:MAG: phenylacetate-CoA oxygenase subunit PaaJ [Chloroflexi bacterium]|nr:phenylacetate-CoA oxygenase subunit PaaJ [Chloroflexota bacterium]MBI3762959.1 phenylacetate-CoA oxygenase subunit PaaJ [Chloroflexota bacterium]